MKKFYTDNRLMSKSSAQRGVISPLMIGGIAVIGIIVFLVASGSFKFSGYIKSDSNKPQENQTEVQAPKPTPKPTEAPKPEVKLNPEAFTDSKLGFSISYPEGWTVSSTTNGVNILKPSTTRGAGQADALISVVNGNLGELKDSKLLTIADLHKVYIKKQFKNVEFTGEKEVKINGTDGYELEFTGALNNENMRAKYIVLKGTNALFALIEVANVGMWNDFEKELDASVQTFKML